MIDIRIRAPQLLLSAVPDADDQRLSRRLKSRVDAVEVERDRHRGTGDGSMSSSSSISTL